MDDYQKFPYLEERVLGFYLYPPLPSPLRGCQRWLTKTYNHYKTIFKQTLIEMPGIEHMLKAMTGSVFVTPPTEEDE